MKRILILSAAIAGFCASPAQAQLGPDSYPGLDTQLRASVSIPFGTKTGSQTTAPKLALSVRQETRNATDWMRRDTQAEMSFGLSLDRSLTFSLNDAPLHSFGETLYAQDETPDSDGKDPGLDGYDKTVLTVIGGSLTVIAVSILLLAD